MDDNSFVDDISYVSTNWNGYRGGSDGKFPNFPSNDNRIHAQDKVSVNKNKKRKDIGYLSRNRNGERHMDYNAGDLGSCLFYRNNLSYLHTNSYFLVLINQIVARQLGSNIYDSTISSYQQGVSPYGDHNDKVSYFSIYISGQI